MKILSANKKVDSFLLSRKPAELMFVVVTESREKLKMCQI